MLGKNLACHKTIAESVALVPNKPHLWLAGLVLFFIATLPSLHGLLFVTSWYNEKRVAQLLIFIALTVTTSLSPNFRIFCIDFLTSQSILNKVLGSIFIFLGIISALFSSLPTLGLMEVANYFLLFWLAVYISFVSQVRSLRNILLYTFCIAAFLYAISFMATLLAGLFTGVVDYHQLLSGFINRRFLNQFQSITFPFLLIAPLVLDVKRNVRFSLVILAAFWVMLMIISDGRGVLVASFCGVVLSSFLLPSHRKKWLVNAVLTVLLGLGLYSIFKFSLSSYEVIDSSSVFRATGGRINIWLYTISMIGEFPLLGIGPMQFAFIAHDIPVAHPHNISLQLLSEWGIPATLALVALVLISFSSWIKQQHNLKNPTLFSLALTASLIASIVHGHFSGVFVMPLSQLTFVVIIGLMMAEYKQNLTLKKSATTATGWQLALPAVSIISLIIILIGSYPHIKSMVTDNYPERLYLNGEYPASEAPRFWSRTYIATPDAPVN